MIVKKYIYFFGFLHYCDIDHFLFFSKKTRFCGHKTIKFAFFKFLLKGVAFNMIQI